MIHVCSLARLHDTVEETGARHVVTLLKDIRPGRAAGQASLAANHLVLGMDDICVADGRLRHSMRRARHAADRLRARLGPREARWWCIATPASAARPPAPLSRPARSIRSRDERRSRRRCARASPTATPNARIVSLADRMLGRDGRMVSAIDSIGRGEMAYEADPFRLDLE